MNIHITENQHKYLQQFVTRTETIGSKLYGADCDKSDTDLLCMYKIKDKSILRHLSRLPSIHQFQYKDIENNIDYIYCTPQQFFYNQASGDSTINSDICLFSEMSWCGSIEMCRTYKVIKGYLGFAKRDLKQYKEGNHKLIHAKRGLYCVEKLMNNEPPLIEDIQEFYQMEHNVTDLIQLEHNLRFDLTHMLNRNELEFYQISELFDKDDDEYVFQLLLNSNNTKEFKY